MRSSSTAKPAQKKLTTSQRSPDRFSTIGLTRGAAEAPPHAGSRPTRPSVRRRDITGALVRYRSALDRRHVEGHAGEYPPMPATEVDPDFSPTNGSPRQPSTRRAIGAKLGCLRIDRAGHAPEPDCLLNQSSVRGGLVAISASSSRRHRVSGARLGRETENPQTHLLAILFFRPGARTPDRRPTNPRAHLTATSLLPAINRLRVHRHRPTTNRR